LDILPIILVIGLPAFLLGVITGWVARYWNEYLIWKARKQ